MGYSPPAAATVRGIASAGGRHRQRDRLRRRHLRLRGAVQGLDGFGPLARPVTGMVRYGAGYLMVGEDGGIFNFSTLAFAGSLGGHPPARPIVAVAALP